MEVTNYDESDTGLGGRCDVSSEMLENYFITDGGGRLILVFTDYSYRMLFDDNVLRGDNNNAQSPDGSMGSLRQISFCSNLTAFRVLILGMGFVVGVINTF